MAGFVPVVLHEPSSLERALATVDAAADTISALGGRVLVLAASTGEEGYEKTGRLDKGRMGGLGRGIDRAMASAGERGLLVALHPHHGTVVERPEDVERVLDVSDVGVCLDTGHVMVAGGDPVAIARSAGSRVIHVHLKDADATIAERVAAGDLGYHAAVAAGLYRPLGEGDVDIRGVLRTVEESGEAVWYVLEHDEVLDHEPEPGSGPLLNARREPRVPGAGVGGGGLTDGEVVQDARAIARREGGWFDEEEIGGAGVLVLACATAACTGDDRGGDGDGNGDGNGAVNQRDFRFVVVTHGQASDPFWSVAANGVDAAAEDMGARSSTRRPRRSTWSAMAS